METDKNDEREKHPSESSESRAHSRSIEVPGYLTTRRYGGSSRLPDLPPSDLRAGEAAGRGPPSATRSIWAAPLSSTGEGSAAIFFFGSRAGRARDGLEATGPGCCLPSRCAATSLGTSSGQIIPFMSSPTRA